MPDSRRTTAIQAGHIVTTDDPKWKAWRYNKSKLGFRLLLIGILLQAVYLFAAIERQIELKPELISAIATAALAIATFVLAFVTTQSGGQLQPIMEKITNTVPGGWTVFWHPATLTLNPPVSNR